ncbi:hypothetical protein SCLCIDRAFT_487796 [Scleroderma citrinum Foug A]|uniref:Uncharacterized protein n=1 Tax=Scleroderma citrinum Foug A TaxID=1036808 RepID=A0A0C2ZIY9_9AGAM|nr:hypothetical protein SCLCIDRAFT_487796 [Scleroderma citrinum Foug A]
MGGLDDMDSCASPWLAAVASSVPNALPPCSICPKTKFRLTLPRALIGVFNGTYIHYRCLPASEALSWLDFMSICAFVAVQASFKTSSTPMGAMSAWIPIPFDLFPRLQVSDVPPIASFGVYWLSAVYLQFYSYPFQRLVFPFARSIHPHDSRCHLSPRRRVSHLHYPGTCFHITVACDSHFSIVRHAQHVRRPSLLIHMAVRHIRSGHSCHLHANAC